MNASAKDKLRLMFDKYYNYNELTEFIERAAALFPRLVSSASIGRSHEGRDIWLVTVTNTATGVAERKPACYIDANIHAGELTGSMAGLHLLQRLTEGYGTDPQITRLLDSRTFYIIPRLNPDGAEWAVSIPPRIIRSGVRPYPDDVDADGLDLEDIDNDGRILTMRLPDPHGDWKINPVEPRLMMRRAPDELDGQFYRLLIEGRIRNYDGDIITTAWPKQRLDFNRNFPAEWEPEGKQGGAGPYPLSEPETRAAAEFVTCHPNIATALCYHTFSDVLLRPPSARPDDQMPAGDLFIYTSLAKRAKELTGFETLSSFHDFRFHPTFVTHGAMDDWLYLHRGILSYTVELWSIAHAAGIETPKALDWLVRRPPEDDIRILHWLDETFDGQGFIPWYRFEHPQLGPVELGGWDALRTWMNPPLPLLEAECAKATAMALFMGAITPQIALRSFTATPLGDGRHLVRAVIENTGFLATSGTQQALAQRAIKPLRLTVELPAGAVVKLGKQTTDLDHLPGRSGKLWPWWGGSDTDNRAKTEWLIAAPHGGKLELKVDAGRAGMCQTQIDLPATS